MTDSIEELDKLLRAQAMVFDIVAKGEQTLNTSPDNLRSIADTLRAAALKLRECREALEPFAELLPENWLLKSCPDHMTCDIDANDIRRAAKALEAKQ